LFTKKVIYLQKKLKLNSVRNNGYKIMAQCHGRTFFGGFKRLVLRKLKSLSLNFYKVAKADTHLNEIQVKKN